MTTKPTLPSTAVGRRRLLKLAGLLEADAKNKKGIRFDLTLWGNAKDTANPVSCGTYACAMGLAVASGAFVRAGLQPPYFGRLVPVFQDADGYRFESFAAAALLFQINDRQARSLFGGSYYTELHGVKAERAVAKRIRQFVAGKAVP